VSLIPVDKNQDFYLDASGLKGVDYMQVFANKYGIIRTETDFEGIVVKGVGTDYNWRYFEDYLVEGRLPNYSDDISTELLLSNYLANRLDFKVGDKVIVYFLDDASAKTPRPIAFDLVGIYTSGFQEFDKTFLIADLLQIQRINKWEKNEVGGFEVFVKDFSAIEEVNYEVYNSIGPYLNSTSIIQQYPSIFDWLSLLDMNIYLIPLVIAVFLLLKFILDCIEESVKHYEWRDKEE
jgi:lipoprotein-releasing system permease protein